MIQSMTGYARGQSRGDWGALILELKSVNHRYLETHFRLPEPMRGLETSLRAQIAASIKRGKVDCLLRYEAPSAAAAGLALDDDVATAVIDAAGALAARIEQPAALDPLDVLRWPGVVRERTVDMDTVAAEIDHLLAGALDSLVTSRKAEGERLDALLRERAAAIGALVAGVRKRLPAVREQIRAKLLARLAEFDLAPDADRLNQELVIAAQRMDVAEEMDRLDSHIQELEAALGRNEPVGRRLDFLMQEFNREANTLASKSQDTETTHAAVEIKVLIEQMREQVQNVE